MTDRIDRSLIAHVARLASLSLTEAESARLTREVADILRYVGELAGLDTSEVPPTAHVQLQETSWRSDEVRPGLSHDEALAQAPRVSQGGFAVPGFMESEG